MVKVEVIKICEEEVKWFEVWIDELEVSFFLFKEFIFFGGYLMVV